MWPIKNVGDDISPQKGRGYGNETAARRAGSPETAELLVKLVYATDPGGRGTQAQINQTMCKIHACESEIC